MNENEKYKCHYCPSCNLIGNQAKNNVCPSCGQKTFDGFFSFKEAQWLRTDDPVFVAFLDILGFKNLVKNNSIRELFLVYKTFLEHMEVSKEFTELSYQTDLFHNTKINSLFISDSLILWSEDFSQTSLFKLVGLVSMLIAESFVHGAPIRGAIDMGEIAVRSTFSNKTLVGKGLTNAFESEESQEWAGCLISESCLDKFNDLSNLQGALKKDYMFDINLVLNYQIPLKEGPQKANAAVNWLYLIKKEFMSEKVILESFEKFNKSTGELRIQRKIENTLSFYEFAKGKTMRDLLNFDF